MQKDEGEVLVSEARYFRLLFIQYHLIDMKFFCYTPKALLNGAIPKWPKGAVCKTAFHQFESGSHLACNSLHCKEFSIPEIVLSYSEQVLRFS